MSTPLESQVGERFRSEVERIGGVSKAFEVAGVSRGTVYNWFESGLIPAVVLERLGLIGLDAAFVVTGVRSKAIQESSKAFGDGHLSSEDIAYAMPPSLKHEIREREEKWGAKLSINEAVELVRSGLYVWVPFYDLPLSGGGGAEVLDQPPKQWNFYTRQYIVNERGLNGANLAEFPVRGHSMAPELYDRDTVMVDRSRTELVGVDLFALRVGNQFFVKYLTRLPDGSVHALSKNDDEYPSFEIQAADLESGYAKVIGRVMRKGQDR